MKAGPDLVGTIRETLRTQLYAEGIGPIIEGLDFPEGLGPVLEHIARNIAQALYDDPCPVCGAAREEP